MSDDAENEPSDSSESLIIAHFNAVRAESMYRMKARENLMYYFFVGAGICFHYYFEHPEKHAIVLLAIPLLASLITSSYIQHDICVKVLGNWAKNEHTKTLKEYASIKGYSANGKAGITFRHWDIYEGEKGAQRKFIANLRYWTNALMPTLVSLFAVIIFTPHLNMFLSSYQCPLVNILHFMIVTFLIVLSLCPAIFMRIAKNHRKINDASSAD